MNSGCKIGWVLCGSFCTLKAVSEQMRALVTAGAQITPIFSFNVATLDTRFGTAEEWRRTFAEITGNEPLCTLTQVEPIGPKAMFDVLVVAPCTGTTLGKLASGISNTPATLAVKSHLRGGRPVVLGVATNDALGASLRNMAQLKNAKGMYFVPMAQDDVQNKPNSLVSNWSLLPNAIDAALVGQQIQPLWVV